MKYQGSLHMVYEQPYHNQYTSIIYTYKCIVDIPYILGHIIDVYIYMHLCQLDLILYELLGIITYGICMYNHITTSISYYYTHISVQYTQDGNQYIIVPNYQVRTLISKYRYQHMEWPALIQHKWLYTSDSTNQSQTKCNYLYSSYHVDYVVTFPLERDVD